MKLRAEELVKKYKSRTVVRGVSFEVEQGFGEDSGKRAELSGFV